MRLGPVTKLDKRNERTLKFADDAMPGNCDFIVIFPIYGQFEAKKTLTSEKCVCTNVPNFKSLA